jgi:hypothetical protein
MNKKGIIKSSFILLNLVLLLVFSTNIFAQSGTSSIKGVVQDTQGQVIPGAKVTLKNESRNFNQTRITNSEGQFSFVSLTPDTYKLEVEVTNFKKSITNVQALVDSVADRIIQLDVGSVTETVEITTQDAPINTSTGAIGQTFDNKQVQDLPLSARNTASLLSLQPGVTQSGEVNGGRSDQANVTLDGVDVNEQQGGQAFFSVLRVSQEALQEFRVVTTNADADKGRSSGAQISLVSKRGNNEWSGSGYFYFRPDKKFQANDFFNNSDRTPQLGFGRRNYGGSFSGPLKKDKLFFFVNYERFDEDREFSINRVVPLASLGTGLVKYFSADGSSDAGCPAGTPAGVTCLTPAEINAAYTSANGITPGLNPIALATLANAASRYRSNNDGAGDGLNTGGYRFNAPTSARNNTFITTLDYLFNEKHTFQGRFQVQSDKGTQIQRFPDTPVGENWSHPTGVAVSHNWIINNNMVNRATYGLTRAAFTNGSDTNLNFTSFRFVFQPFNFNRSIARVTPVHNITDDFTWIKGNHTITAGANVRFVSNQRKSFGSSFDNAIMNPSFYASSGRSVTNPFSNFSDQAALRDALTAVIGRYSQYSINAQYAKNGSVLPLGTASTRNFKTEEFEFYLQDSYKMFSSLTLNYGVRYSTSTPVYEANGLQVKPVQSLGEFFDNRVNAANNGTSFNGLISIDLAGKANNKGGYYKQDWNNFAPTISAAWSPNFKNSFLKALFGGDNKSVIRGGYRLTYDRLGSALAVAFDLNSTLGFSATSATAANRFNLSTRLGPLFTGFNEQVRGNPLFNAISSSNTITFPLQTAADEAERIEQSLDDRLTTPYHHNFNVSYGRELWKGISMEASYVGRIARNLLVSRDTAHFNNLRDPVSGQDFYGAMRQLIAFRNSNTQISAVPNIAWFNRFVPNLAANYGLGALTPTQAAYAFIARDCGNNRPRDPITGLCPAGSADIGGFDIFDYTFAQVLWDDDGLPTRNSFVHPQYATFAAYSSIGTSDYHGAQFSFRKRFAQGLSFDVNYTFSHSLDIASGTETSGAISSGASLILNPLDLNENRASSDFDIRHLINANFVYELPFGKGKKFFGSSNKAIDAIFGGWQLSGIYRWNSGAPIGQPFDSSFWATNWNVQSNGVRLTDLRESPTRNGSGGRPNLFSDIFEAYKNYRNAYPGEAGDRNILRDESFISLDLGLKKTFAINEKHKVSFRFDVFNVTNTQRLTGISSFSLDIDPSLTTNRDAVPQDWGRFTNTQGTPRVVQFAFRYDF